MMDPELKAKWVAALRSGEYKQTGGHLRYCDLNGNPKGYCCLGVLCDVMDPEGWGARFHDDDAGLPEPSMVGAHQPTLIDMNDREGRSFAEIADFIEKNL